MLLLIYVYICMVLLTQGKSLLLIYIRVTSFILQLIHTNASTRATDMTDNITSSLLWFSFPKSLFLSVNLCLRVCSRQWIFWDEWDRNIKSQPTGLSSKHIQTWESYYCCSLHSSALFKNTSVCRNGNAAHTGYSVHLFLSTRKRKKIYIGFCKQQEKHCLSFYFGVHYRKKWSHKKNRNNFITEYRIS